jgi:molybdate transport system ATP-binding protein
VSATLAASLATPLRNFELEASIEVRPGAPLALAGPSGAGKTSLLRAIAGLLMPRAGRIQLGDEAWLDTERRFQLPAERRACGLLFQDYALFPSMSAWRNVAYGMRRRHRERRAAALEMLARFGVDDLAEARPAALSGGERQRVALARALASMPRVLLLDEPLSALDSTTRRAAVGELHSLLAGLETPAILVTHSFEEAALLASTIAIVDRGSVVQAGEAATISAHPASPFVADFAGAVVLRGDASGEGDGLTLVRLHGGGEARSVDRARGPVALSVFPWEVALEPPGSGRPDSMLNRVEGEVTAVTTVGNRARVGIAVPQALSAEVTAQSAQALGLRAGVRVSAAWKASATRLIALDRSAGRRPGSGPIRR